MCPFDITGTERVKRINDLYISLVSVYGFNDFLKVFEVTFMFFGFAFLFSLYKYLLMLILVQYFVINYDFIRTEVLYVLSHYK